MTRTFNDPVDHLSTTRRHAGETLKDPANAPGMLLMAVAVIAFACGVYGVAVGAMTAGILALTTAAVTGAIGLRWFAVAHRRVREAERSWHAQHPDVPYEPPTS